MALFLANKHILLGVTGSIAAYKSADVIRRLREAGAIVRVVMTENAKQFITPLTLQAVSGLPIHDNLFDLQAESAMGHIELARWADLILVAPASADFMARLQEGRANDLLTTLCLATRAPIALAPAMNRGMWHHTLTEANQQALLAKNIHFLGPAAGSQACGDNGFGRMIEPIEIVNAVDALFANGLLAGVNVLVTAGPTHEAIDPIRYLTNISSGKMGYALAEAAQEAGANVTLISGPVQIAPPARVNFIPVKTALEMQEAVQTQIATHPLFIAVAAVSDYRAQAVAQQKLHKDQDNLTVSLIRNPDIVAEVGRMLPKPFIVGFAAETENLIAQAQAKLKRKNMDMIIANQVGNGRGMGTTDNQVTVIFSNEQIPLSLKSKTQLARELIPIIANQFKSGRQP